MATNECIRVFEHDSLQLSDEVDGVCFEQHHLQALRLNYGENGCPFYQLTYKGVKFKEYVGVLQVGALTIEVLPKADKSNQDKALWHGFLIDMLRKAGFLEVYDTGYASLRLKSNSILDLYIELFVKEVRYLLQTGLVKKYRTTWGNNFALKGSLVFSKNIQQNLVHAERFYVRHSIYDHDNIFNQILYKTLLLTRHLTSSYHLTGQIENLLLDFPECKDMIVNDSLFERLVFDRKTESYERAIIMAKLLLLNYYPDIRRGNNHVLALMFNMNELWEVYVYKVLRKRLAGDYVVKSQIGKNFWQPKIGRVARVYPDILVYDLSGKMITILDTKWKNLSGYRPSGDDLKQMFVYNLYYDCVHSALLYPATNDNQNTGTYSIKSHGKCSLLFLTLEKFAGSIQLNLAGLMSHIEAAKMELELKSI